jgi:hypothetical protein
MLGVWMLISPFVFQHPASETNLWANDFVSAGVLILCSLASYWRPFGWAHGLLFPYGAWLICFGRMSQAPPLPGGRQNQVIVGLLLMMFAIIPNHASQPPIDWQRRLGAELD